MKTRKLYYLFFLLCFIIRANTFSQSITHGPIVGAVTDHSATIVFFTDQQCSGNILISGNDQSKNISIPFSSGLFNVVKIELKDLAPLTVFRYRVVINNKETKTVNGFKTFPKQNEVSNFSFAFGSCTEQHHDDSIFIEMQKHDPAFFLHLGDWLYPDNFTSDPFYFNQNLERLKSVYEKRYAMPNLSRMLQTVPVDYIFDDEDGVWDDFSKTSHCVINTSGNKTGIKEISYPDSLRKNVIKGYEQFFPGYNEVKDEVYHSFVYGNCEFLFVDTRSTRSPNSEVFYKKKNGRWNYKVPKGHQLLDSAQLQWLLIKLQNSTADWKFIVSGVTFNKSYKKVLDICIKEQQELPNKMTGAYIAASLASMWFAYPETQKKILDLCNRNKIKNVIILSGDAHTAAIDDGKNSGFPELMAGGLAQKNSKLASIIKNDLRLNLWNRGGQGINNNNFNDAFGQVQVFGRDSVKLSAVDKYGTEICSYFLKDGFIPKKYKLRKHSKITFGNKMRTLKNLLKIAVHRRK